MPKTSPGNILHGSRQNLYSIGTHLDSKAQDFRQPEIVGGGEPASQDTAVPANPKNKFTSTNRYVFTFNSFKCQLSHCRMTKTLSTKLGTNHTGSLDPASCQKISNRFFGDPCPKLPTQANDSKCRKSSTNRDQSTKTSFKGGHPLSFTCQYRAGAFKHPISCTQKRGGAAPRSKFETVESEDSLQAFHDGGDPYVEGSVEKRGLFGQNRSERRLPNCTHLSQTPKVSPLSLESQHVGVCMPPLWSCKCAQGVRQATQACSFHFKTNGVGNNHLSGRYPNYVRISRPSLDTCINSTKPFRGLRVCSKLRKVLFKTRPGNRVSRFRNKFANPNNSSPKRQNQKYKEVSKSTRQSKPISSRNTKIPGAPNFFHPGNFPSPSPLSLSSICQKPGAETVPVLQEVQWWRDHLIAWNGRAIVRQPVQLTIETDASTKGWGAYCQGISTGGRWSPEEKELHINCLELLAGSLAVKTFAKGVGKVHILLLMDSVSAVSYINKLGGTHLFVLNSLAHDLWTWCQANHVNLTAQHIPGVANTLAD